MIRFVSTIASCVILITGIFTLNLFLRTDIVTQAGDISIDPYQREIFKKAHAYHGIDESWFDYDKGEYGFIRNDKWCPLFRSMRKKNVRKNNERIRTRALFAIREK